MTPVATDLQQSSTPEAASGSGLPAPPRPGSRSHGYALPLAGILLAVLLLRLASLAISGTELGFDEAQYWAWAQEPAFGYFSKPPLIAWVIGAATALCGDGAPCVRLPAAVFHIGASLLLFLVAMRLYDAATAFWSAVMYALLPGVAVSSALMTTDAPLLFFWIAAMLAYVLHIRRPRATTALLLGLTIGLGLNAKYAMVYFPLAAALHVAFTPTLRSLAWNVWTWTAIAFAMVLIAPNLLWNATNGYATFAHTSDNIGSLAPRLDPASLLEFLSAQFGLLGPVVFGGLLWFLATRAKTPRPDSDRLLLFLSVPVILLLSAQALRSHANGNWAATAYPAIVILTTALALSGGWRKSFLTSLAINATASVLFATGFAVVDPQASGMPRLVQQLGGWREFADGVDRLASPTGVTTIVADGRIMTAGLLHALRDRDYDVRALVRPDSGIDDHFKFTRPWRLDSPGPVLLVSAFPPPPGKPAQLVGNITLRGGYLARDGGYQLWRLDGE